MGLDVETPDPPSLRNPPSGGDYEATGDVEDVGDDAKRANLAGFLREGAWKRAFEEWADETYLTEAEFRSVVDLGLVEAFDFYWNRADDDVGYRAPTLPDPLPEPHASRLEGEVDAVNGELDALGRTVSEALEEYVLRDDQESGYGFFADEGGPDEGD